MKRLLLGSIFIVASATSSLAADLDNFTPEPAPQLADRFDWSGFYVGGNAGYARADVKITEATLTSNPGYQSYADDFNGNATSDGALLGGQIGYNHQFENNVVFGIEADAMWSGMSGGYSGGDIADVDIDIEWVTTARLRLGYAFDRLLVYGTGGMFVAGAKAHLYSDRNTTSATARTTHVSWTVGAGAEYAFNQNWSLKAEYLYLDAPSKNYHFEGIIDELGSSTQIINAQGGAHANYVRAGLNYRF
jgi:outer membrane immunogenic protein